MRSRASWMSTKVIIFGQSRMKVQEPQDEVVNLTCAGTLWHGCHSSSPSLRFGNDQTNSMRAQQDTHSADVARYRQNYLVEMDGIALYRSMAAAEKDKTRAEIFEKLAQNEERHAQRWARLLQAAGSAVPDYRRSMRVRALGWMARRFGTRRVVPIISSLESRDEAGYMHQPEAVGLPAEERAHSRA